MADVGYGTAQNFIYAQEQGVDVILRITTQLLGVEPIGKPLLHCLNDTQSRRLLVEPDVGCGSTSFRHDIIPLNKVKNIYS